MAGLLPSLCGAVEPLGFGRCAHSNRLGPILRQLPASGLSLMSQGTKRFPSLGATLVVFVILLFGSLGTVAAFGAFMLVERQGEAALEEAVAVRGRGLATTFARSLHQSWTEVAAVAAEIGSPRPDETIRQRLQSLTIGNSWIAWAGYARLDGTVEVASGGLLEGESVSARPWFSQGLEGPFAGDAHDAVLLSERLGASLNEPLLFLDLAAPVPGPDRRPVGVVGVHIDVSKATQRFRETATALDVEAFLVASGGSVLIAPDDVEIERIDAPSFRAGRIGAGRPFVETWSDGKRSMTVVQDVVGYRDLPDFGWSILVRLPMERLAVDRAGHARTLLLAFGGGLLAVLVATLLYIRLYVNPIARMATSATAIAAGEDVYPYESRRTREVAALAAAIATLQSRGSA